MIPNPYAARWLATETESSKEKAAVFAWMAKEVDAMLRLMDEGRFDHLGVFHYPKMGLGYGRGTLILGAFQNPMTENQVAVRIGIQGLGYYADISKMPHYARWMLREVLKAMGFNPVFGWKWGNCHGTETGFNYVLKGRTAYKGVPELRTLIDE